MVDVMVEEVCTPGSNNAHRLGLTKEERTPLATPDERTPPLTVPTSDLDLVKGAGWADMNGMGWT